MNNWNKIALWSSLSIAGIWLANILFPDSALTIIMMGILGYYVGILIKLLPIALIIFFGAKLTNKEDIMSNLRSIQDKINSIKTNELIIALFILGLLILSK